MQRNRKQQQPLKNVHEKEYHIQGFVFKWAKPCFSYRERAEKLKLKYEAIIENAIKPIKLEMQALGIEQQISTITRLSSEIKNQKNALNLLRKKQGKGKKNKALRKEINDYAKEIGDANKLLLEIAKTKEPELKEYNYLFKKILEIENAHRSIFVASNAKEILDTCLDLTGKKIDYYVSGADFLQLEKTVHEVFGDFFLSFQNSTKNYSS